MPTPSKTVYKIGITGTIASGKSLIGAFLEEAQVPVLDTDQVVANLYTEDDDLKHQLASTFGKNLLDEHNQIDKKQLRQVAFYDPDKRHQLEALVHPRVKAKVADFFAEANNTPVKAVLVPLLFEAQTEALYDEVWSIWVEPMILMKRLMERDQLTQEEAQRRLTAQWSQDEKAAHAHHKIDNSGTPDQTKTQVLQALQNALKKAISHE